MAPITLCHKNGTGVNNQMQIMMISERAAAINVFRHPRCLKYMATKNIPNMVPYTNEPNLLTASIKVPSRLAYMAKRIAYAPQATVIHLLATR